MIFEKWFLYFLVFGATENIFGLTKKISLISEKNFSFFKTINHFSSLNFSFSNNKSDNNKIS
jgi:hypothetical protein